MSEIFEGPPLYTAKSKRNVLLGLIGITLASGLVTWIVPGLAGNQLFSYLTTIAFAVALLMWCGIDSRERGIHIGPGFRILIVILGPIPIIYYLFRSRGFTRGAISVGLMLLFALALAIINLTETLTLALISDRLGVFKNI